MARSTLASRLDRRVTFLTRSSEVQESVYGTRAVTWDVLAEVWANVQDDLPPRGENLADDVLIARQTCRIEIRWRNDITSDLRLTIAGRDGEWRIITPPAEYGRRESLIFKAEQVSIEGQEP